MLAEKLKSVLPRKGKTSDTDFTANRMKKDKEKSRKRKEKIHKSLNRTLI